MDCGMIERRGRRNNDLQRETIRFLIASVIESILKLFNWKSLNSWGIFPCFLCFVPLFPASLFTLEMSLHETSGCFLCLIDYLSGFVIRHIFLYLHLRIIYYATFCTADLEWEVPGNPHHSHWSEEFFGKTLFVGCDAIFYKQSK